MSLGPLKIWSCLKAYKNKALQISSINKNTLYQILKNSTYLATRSSSTLISISATPHPNKHTFICAHTQHMSMKANIFCLDTKTGHKKTWKSRNKNNSIPWFYFLHQYVSHKIHYDSSVSKIHLILQQASHTGQFVSHCNYVFISHDPDRLQAP